ncbi:MAG: Ig-like domain-containing protein [Lachnospiraceae bacterium]|nr:Ig-like domain-containing protein [Lachnospiraceae bacterium]
MQRRSGSQNPHSMIVVYTDPSREVIGIFDANTDGNNLVKRYDQTYEDFYYNNLGVSLYHYAGYSYEYDPESSHNPDGDVRIHGGNGCVSVNGYAYDIDDMYQPISIHVYIGGPAGTPEAEGHSGLTTEWYHAAVPEGNHGFSADVMTSKTGYQPVYVYAINYGRGTDHKMIGSDTVYIEDVKPDAPRMRTWLTNTVTPGVSMGNPINTDRLRFNDFYYLCYELLESDSDSRFDGGRSSYTVRETITDPSGNTVISYEYPDSNYNFVGGTFDKAGTYTCTVEIMGDYIGSASWTVDIPAVRIYMDCWISATPGGNEVSAIEQGKDYYLCYAIRHNDSDRLLNDVAVCSYNVTSSVTSPSGKTVSSTIFRNSDNNSLRFTASETGTYKGLCTFSINGVVIKGDTQANSAAKTVEPTSIDLDKGEVFMTEGDTLTLKATILPTNATNKSVSWRSGNSSVVTVQNGVLRALKKGVTTVYATTYDGKLKDSCLVYVDKKTVNVTGVTLSKNSLTMEIGDSYTLTENITPSDADNKNVSWKSGNSSVATVKNGVVTAVGEGTTKITVTTVDGSKTATCDVKVNPKVIPATGISLNKKEMSLKTGEKGTVLASVLPLNATDQTITWKSGDSNVATISGGADGIVTAVGSGHTVLTAYTKDGKFNASCDIWVSDREIAATEIALDKKELTIGEGETATLSAVISPADATDKTVVWESSAPQYASVTNGTVTGIKAGNATISVKNADGSLSAKCTVNVEKEEEKIINVTGVSLSTTELKMTVGEERALSAAVLPANATNRNVVWSVKDQKVASVSDGLVIAKGAGTTVLTVTSEDGAKKEECTIIVEKEMEEDEEDVVHVKSVELDRTQAALKKGETIQLKAAVLPENSANPGVDWESSDETVATVKDGLVKAVENGTAMISAIAKDGGIRAVCSVLITDEDIQEEEPEPDPKPEPEPEPEPEPDPEPEPEPEPEPDPEPEPSPDGPNVGDMIELSEAIYMIEDVGTEPKVSYLMPMNYNAVSVRIPDTISSDGTVYEVTSISSLAFLMEDKLQSVVIGENVEEIGEKAFFRCKGLKRIQIETTKLTPFSVGKDAFKKTSKRIVVSVPASVYKSYKKLLKKRGISRKAIIRKIDG